jgi:tetratricopeptide (TPR) repeat protein
LADERFGRQASVIVAVALAVRLVHLWSMRNSPFSDVLLGDARSYDEWARQIAAGDWIGQGVFYQAPLYAYFLGALYTVNRSLTLVRVCQAVVGAIGCVLLGRATQHLFGKTAGLLAGLTLALYAPAVFFDGLVQKSVLDVFLLCLLLALLTGFSVDRTGRGTQAGGAHRRSIAAGAVLGALSLTRENALIFLPVVLIWIWWCFRSAAAGRVSMMALFVAGAGIVLLPIGLRNLKAGGEFHLTTAQFGTNFFIGNNPHADGAYVPIRVGRGSPEYERVDATELAAQAIGRAPSPGDVSSYWTARALQYIRAQPVDWLALEARKLRLLLNATEVIDTESQESHEDYSWLLRLLGHVAHFGVLAPLACLGVWLTWDDRGGVWLLYAMMGAYVLSVLAFYVVARYRLPLVPFMILFAAAAMVRVHRVLAIWTPAGAMTAVAALAGVTVFCNVPILSADTMRAVTYQNLGTALQEAGRLDEAAAAFERALILDPDYAPARNGLGSVRRQQDRPSEAIAHLEAALRLRPDFDTARFNLANALREGGHRAEAIANYEVLLRRMPEDLGAHANLGVVLAEEGRLDEAIDHFRRVVVLAPGTAKAHYNLGHSLLTRGDLAGAADELSRAVEIDPQDVASREELGSAYLAQRRFVPAIEQFRAAIRLAPRSAGDHNDLGIALGSAGNFDDAIAEFRAALGIDPSSAEAGANLKAALAARPLAGHVP